MPDADPTPDSHDGTSQAGRALPALDPDYVGVDERSTRAMLEFAKSYAAELRDFGPEAAPARDWTGFLPDSLDLDDAAALLDDPESVPPDRAGPLTRPHFVLFLAFLHLRRFATGRLNALTRRHLDFYYRSVLRLSKKGAVPDRVNVLIDLAAGVDRAWLPAGTALSAGQDDAGRDLAYRTDRDLVAGRARVARLSAVHVEKRITGIREARERPEGTQPERALRMFRIALGRPRPGDPLPPYPPKGETVDYPSLLRLKALVDFAASDLFMSFSDLRDLVPLKRRRDMSEGDWSAVNLLLEAAGKVRTGDPNFRLSPKVSSDFADNLVAAVGPLNFDGLPQVDDIDDLYEQRGRLDVQQFIEKYLFIKAGDFVAMMRLKQLIENEWDAINGILESAGRRKSGDPGYRLAVKDRADFPANLNAAIGTPNFARVGSSDIEGYYDDVRRAEDYFSMSAERFGEVMAAVAEENWATGTTGQQWERVDRYLAEAHAAKVYEDRRQALRARREADGFDAMIHLALGEDPASAAAKPLDRLGEYVQDADDSAFLRDVAGRKPDAVTADDWDRVYRIVEVARRIREGFVVPDAREEEWLNVSPLDDATTATVASGPEAGPYPRWRMFGRPSPTTRDDPPPPVLGWAIRSPMLELGQGRRVVTLTLGFAAESFDAKAIGALLASASPPFRFQVSTEKGWVEPSSWRPGPEAGDNPGDYAALSGVSTKPKDPLKAIQFRLAFGPEIDPIAPTKPAEGQTATPWPVLRLMLLPAWDEEIRGFRAPYAEFRELSLERAHLAVEVGGGTPGDDGPGLTDLSAQNDEAALDVRKPFEPFGPGPSAGSRLLLGHPELVHKRLDSLRFRFEWMGVPVDLGEHYKNYPAPAGTSLSNEGFTARVSLVDRKVDRTLLAAAPLFASGAAAPAKKAAPGDPQAIRIDDVATAAQGGSASYRYDRALDDDLGDDLLSWGRYFQWQLNAPDFQHPTYPALAARKSAELAAAVADAKGQVDAKPYLLNPPYTPKIKSLSLDYTASLEVILSEYRPGDQADRIDHVHPFGLAEIRPEDDGPRYSLLPRYDDEGELYIGVSDLEPPRTLSVLFQLAEGSADPDLEPAPVGWSYLSGDAWVGLDAGGVLSDTTRGLINSGIIEFAIGPVEPGARMPSGLVWLRATVARDAGSVCDAVGIHAQAVSATFVGEGDDAAHYAQPLPPGGITGLVEPLPEVSGVRQLYSSFGGRAEEGDATFATRVSERLRHKQRALTAWDYERLVLERFPEIYKAKCIPSGSSADDLDGPGKVAVVVIPDIRNRLPFNPFEPKAPADLVADIRSFLIDKIPLSARLEVRNARFVQVKVRVGVRFAPGADVEYFKPRLVEELNRFLSPWAYEEGADIVIGGRIYANSIVNFIDRRPYVDFVARIALFTSDDGETFRPAPDTDEAGGYSVATDRPDGVLVAARTHEIDVIPEVGYEVESLKGINYMRIELDFIVAPDGPTAPPPA